MNAITSLNASATAFDTIGDTFSARACRSLAREVASMGVAFEPGFTEQVNYFAKLAERKVTEFHSSPREAGGGSHQPNKQPAQDTRGEAA